MAANNEKAACLHAGQAAFHLSDYSQGKTVRISTPQRQLLTP